METTLEIPDTIAREMNKHQLINWNEIIAKELIFKVSERQIVEEILKNSKLTEKDAEEISEKIKESLAEQYHVGAHS